MPEVQPTDEAADKVVTQAARRLAGEHEEHSLNVWFLVAVWGAVGTLATVYFETDYPAEGWYDWPLIWIGATMLTGIGLTVLYGMTVLLHSVWWQHFGRRRDERRRAEFLDER